MTFIDTNILLYAISSDPGEKDKASKAKTILGGAGLALSVQVLQEFYVQATRPTRPDPLNHCEAAALIQ
ncbi:MAG: twitching motility protein PilT, partial [Terrimicrobiaceae bacterium]